MYLIIPNPTHLAPLTAIPTSTIHSISSIHILVQFAVTLGLTLPESSHWPHPRLERKRQLPRSLII